jgi:hypothetical protein
VNSGYENKDNVRFLHDGHSKNETEAPIVCLSGKFGLAVVPLPEASTTLQDIVKESHRAIKEFG